jgi:hypothetical protein
MDGTLLLVFKIVSVMWDEQNPIITASLMYLLDDHFFSYIFYFIFTIPWQCSKYRLYVIAVALMWCINHIWCTNKETAELFVVLLHCRGSDTVTEEIARLYVINF